MFDKRLMVMCPESKKYIAGNILFQWAELILNAGMIFLIAFGMGKLYEKSLDVSWMMTGLFLLLAILVIRFFTTK